MEKKYIKAAVQLCAFVMIANLPFLTMTQLLGIDTFLDSFQHPNSYQYLKNDKINTPDQKKEYIILEKPTHQDYTITQGDTILYRSTEDKIEYRTVYSTQVQHGEKTYYTTTPNKDGLEGPIFEYQILGKSTGVIEDNIWNALSIQIWGLSIENLNAVALFTNK
jgi:hypothetical protein